MTETLGSLARATGSRRRVQASRSGGCPDTVSLTAKNRNNIDPMLVARLADASLLVVSRKLLKSAKLSEVA